MAGCNVDGTNGEPELFLLRSLLLRAESIGWLFCLWGWCGSGGSWPVRIDEAVGGLCEKTVELKVTVRAVFCRGPDVPEWVGRRGSFSDIFDDCTSS